MGQCRFSSGGGGEINEAALKNYCHSTAPKACYFTAIVAIRREKRGAVED